MSHRDRPSRGGRATEGAVCTGAARYPGERGADSSSWSDLEATQEQLTLRETTV